MEKKSKNADDPTRREYHRKYREEHREEINARKRRYFAMHKEQHRDNMRRYRAKLRNAKQAGADQEGGCDHD